MKQRMLLMETEEYRKQLLKEKHAESFKQILSASFNMNTVLKCCLLDTNSPINIQKI
jgi:hypothetical protein